MASGVYGLLSSPFDVSWVPTDPTVFLHRDIELCNILTIIDFASPKFFFHFATRHQRNEEHGGTVGMAQ